MASTRILDDHHGREHDSEIAGRDRPPPVWRRLPSLAGAVFDRVALRAMEPLFLSGGRPSLEGDIRARVDEAARTYANGEVRRSPGRFYPPVAAEPEMRIDRLGRLPRGERLRVIFDSPYRTFEPGYQAEYDDYDRNAVARFHYFTHRERGAPTVVVLHSWCGGFLPFEERLYDARGLYDLGFDVVLFTLPFHGSRTPRQARFPGQLFPSRDVRRTNEAFGQAIADLRVTMRWLRKERGSGPIGLMGISLGGYTAALAASLDPSIAFVVPIAAPCSFTDIMWHHGRGRPGRREVEDAGITLADVRALGAVHSPLTWDPPEPSRALLVFGHGDRIVPRVHALALWEHWKRPRTVWFDGGHVLQLGLRGYRRVVHEWLASRSWEI